MHKYCRLRSDTTKSVTGKMRAIDPKDNKFCDSSISWWPHQFTSVIFFLWFFSRARKMESKSSLFMKISVRKIKSSRSWVRPTSWWTSLKSTKHIDIQYPLRIEQRELFKIYENITVSRDWNSSFFQSDYYHISLSWSKDGEM